MEEKILDYLKKVSGMKDIDKNWWLASDLHLNSKEIIDFAIYFFNISGKKLSLSRDFSIGEILSMCE